MPIIRFKVLNQMSKAVDFLVKKTYVSGAESADIGPRHVENSTAPPANPSPKCQHDHLIGESRKRKYEEPLEPVDSDVNEHCVTDGHKDVVEVSQFIPEFYRLKGENSSTPDCVQVKGRLKAHVEFWVKIQAPNFIIQCITEGYKIPFYETPPRASFENNGSTNAHKEFVTKSIQELLVTGRIVQTSEDNLLVISPLSVSVNKDKKHDGLDMENSLQVSRETAATVRSDIKASGFVPNDQKSVWEPTQIICWLGLQWDGVLGTIAISPQRIETLFADLNDVINQEKVSARTLARVVGRIISTGPVTGNLARIMSRRCQMSIANMDTSDTPSVLDHYSLLELKFWQDNIKARNFLEQSILHTACLDLFTEEETVTSSSYRELLAIQFGIASFEPLLKGCSIKWFTDSQSAMKIAQVGSMRLDCHKLAIAIFSMCLKSGIQLDIQWIPRTQNTQADYISKFTDYDDWEITTDTFQQLEALFGPHTVDCFASYRNAKVKNFSPDIGTLVLQGSMRSIRIGLTKTV
ncbi:Hypothetical predicted protein [Paramuricea clavata]|uniref:Uncharacterized protein n=1 Tax=Paramuricea clavata TaxID=317549 RepID=A0A6S7JTS2_PARCT|nr:Hypothetical predicted protein [Paramuricea clavata]